MQASHRGATVSKYSSGRERAGVGQLTVAKCQMPATTMFTNVSGTTNFQAKLSSWSKRKRGTVPRAQMNTAISAPNLAKNHSHDGNTLRNASGAFQPPRNSV